MFSYMQYSVRVGNRHGNIQSLQNYYSRESYQSGNEIFLSIVYMGGNRKMAVENKRSCRERPILSLLVPELPKGEYPVILH